MLRRRRAGPRKEVGAWRCHRQLARPQQRLRHRMAGDAHGDSVQPARHVGSRGRPAAQHQRQRPRPQGRAQPQRVRRRISRNRRHLLDSRNVDDQRVAVRPALGRKDALHRRRVQRIGPQAIDSLGGKGNQFAGGQGRGGLGNCSRIRRKGIDVQNQSWTHNTAHNRIRRRLSSSSRASASVSGPNRNVTPRSARISFMRSKGTPAKAAAAATE